jgi:hypothetical protein
VSRRWDTQHIYHLRVLCLYPEPLRMAHRCDGAVPHPPPPPTFSFKPKLFSAQRHVCFIFLEVRVFRSMVLRLRDSFPSDIKQDS